VPGLKGRFFCVWNCLIFIEGQYTSVWPEICCVLSKFNGYSYVEFQEITILGDFFINFVQTKVILYQNLWNFALLFEILFWVCIAQKKFTQVLSYVVYTQVRRQNQKQLRKKRYGKRKARMFCFWKTSFVHSRSWTSYALLLGYFGLKFLPNVCHRAYWVLA